MVLVGHKKDDEKEQQNVEKNNKYRRIFFKK
jgi:hypothetical protein